MCWKLYLCYGLYLVAYMFFFSDWKFMQDLIKAVFFLTLSYLYVKQKYVKYKIFNF